MTTWNVLSSYLRNMPETITAATDEEIIAALQGWASPYGYTIEVEIMTDQIDVYARRTNGRRFKFAVLMA